VNLNGKKREEVCHCKRPSGNHGEKREVNEKTNGARAKKKARIRKLKRTKLDRASRSKKKRHLESQGAMIKGKVTGGTG